MTNNSIDQKFALTTSKDVNNFDNLSNKKKNITSCSLYRKAEEHIG